MSGRNAKLLNRMANLAKRPDKPFKRAFLARNANERAALRRSMIRELLGAGRMVGGPSSGDR